MIHVRQDEAAIPPEWSERAARLTAEMEQLADLEQRKQFIEGHRAAWAAVKDQLLRMSYGKCWYSEAPDAVSDWHVDHFRPKSVYQWLAFDWRNFRVCGAIPNRKKSDEFPLANGMLRATWQARDHTNEASLLLDPANSNDPELITFDEEGLPKPINPNWPIVGKRVQVTTETLGLDSPRLVDARKRHWRECQKWIDELRLLLPMELERIDDERRQQIGRIENRVRAMANPQSPYSSVVRACLKAAGMEYLIPRPEHANAG